MILSTNEPIITNRNKLTRQISHFWDQISPGWRILWGLHIHHGYYENGVSIDPHTAQETLIKKIINNLPITSGSKILDVGCGMGGSSLFLAENYDTHVTGITLSQKQVQMAEQLANSKNVKNVIFKIEDALSMESIPSNSFDIVWSLESCEQFYDKKLFLKQAYRVLKPGGKLMLATWCSSQENYAGLQAKKYKKLCFAFDVPYMPTMDSYNAFLTQQNFKVDLAQDWTHYVKPSWDVGISILKKHSLFKIVRLSGIRGLRFVKQIFLMRDAFHNNEIKYGIFIARK